MANAALFLTDGFEEIEALTPVDILRRGGVEVTTGSLTGVLMVEGSHDIHVEADKLFDEMYDDVFDMLILPGGPGHKNYKNNDALQNLIKEHYDNGMKVAAICAAPSLLGAMGLLDGRRAVCFPGYEQELTGALVCDEAVVEDGNIITGRSAGAAMDFALRLLKALKGEEAAEEVRKAIVYMG
jgi:4-methyl-5(b-hydroxyethyl)-thiazole monophosphate biosynthesis